MTTYFNSPNAFYGSSFIYFIHPKGPSLVMGSRKAIFIALYSHLKITIFIMAARLLWNLQKLDTPQKRACFINGYTTRAFFTSINQF
jgi:hypothetical protein